MKKAQLFLYFIMSLFCITNISNAKTFVIDFDSVFIDKSKHFSYLDVTIDSSAKKLKNRQEIKDLIKKHQQRTNIENMAKLLEDLNKKSKFFINKDHLKSVASKIQSPQNSTKLLIDAILKSGDEIIVIGGGVFGCYVLTDYLAQFSIPTKNVYSGYFKNLSTPEIAKAIVDKNKYYNCADLDLKLPDTADKDKIINSLELKDVVKVGDFY